MKFGIVAMASGLVGVPLGPIIAQKWRTTNAACDPIICAYGVLISAPLVYLVLITSGYNTGLSFMFVFFAMVSLNLTWSLVADMVLVRIVYNTAWMDGCARTRMGKRNVDGITGEESRNSATQLIIIFLVHFQLI